MRELASESSADATAEGSEVVTEGSRRVSTRRSSSVGTAQVQLGIARGHALMDRFLNLVKDEKQLPALLKWKATGVLEVDNKSIDVSRQNSVV